MVCKHTIHTHSWWSNYAHTLTCTAHTPQWGGRGLAHPQVHSYKLPEGFMQSLLTVVHTGIRLQGVRVCWQSTHQCASHSHTHITHTRYISHTLHDTLHTSHPHRHNPLTHHTHLTGTLQETLRDLWTRKKLTHLPQALLRH